MTINHNASPNALVEDAVQAEEAPTLWNPNAAANWSLIFSPAFGAYLHMKNWRALGEPQRADSAKRWIIVVLAIIASFSVFGAFLPNGAIRFAGIGLLMGWYFSSARPQVSYIKERFGTTYPRKNWTKPLFFGVLASVAFIVVITIVFLALQWLVKHSL